MAGRPAASRGGNGLLYGLIAFAVVSVLSLGAFIWQLTANKRLATAAEEAQRRLSQVGTPPAYYRDEATARGSSVVAVMNDDLKALATLTVGQADAVRPAIEEQVRKVLTQMSAAVPDVVKPGDPLLGVATQLFTALREGREQIAALERQVADLQKQLAEKTDALAAAQKQFADEIGRMKARIAQLEQDKSKQLAKKDQQLEELTKTNQTLQEQLNRYQVEETREDRETEITFERMRRQIRTLEAKLEELNPSGWSPEDILTKADGKILRAIPGSDIVYINLGRADRIKPGMTFEVFSPYSAGRGRFRGKASIEVDTVMEQTAECRVRRRTPGKPIIEGDIVVNIAYERNRRPKFVVRGQFDLNYDGIADYDGAEKIKAIIRAWGGEVAEKLDETTDFVVIGTGPQVPQLRPGRPVSPVVADLAETRAAELQQFRDLIRQARDRFIPVITQNQFLFLTGYAGTGPVMVP